MQRKAEKLDIFISSYIHNSQWSVNTMSLTACVLVHVLLVTFCNGNNMYNIDSGPRINDTVGNNKLHFFLIK